MGVLVLVKFKQYKYKSIEYKQFVPAEPPEEDEPYLKQTGYFLWYEDYSKVPEIYKSPNFLPSGKLPANRLDIDLSNKRILFKRNGGFGDVIVVIGAIEAIKRKFPTAYISLACQDWQFPVARLFPAVDSLVYYRDSRSFSTICSYDVLVDFTGVIEDNVGRKRIDYYTLHRDFLIEKYKATFLKDICIEPPHMDFSLLPEDEVSAYLSSLRLYKGEYVVLHAGGSSILRRWNNVKWKSLAYYITSNSDKKVIFVGSKYDFVLSDEASGIYSITTFSLDRVASVLKNSAFLITTDTGMLHLAGVLDIPVVCLWGPTSPKVVSSVYKNKQIHVISGGCKLAPCFFLRRSRCPNLQESSLCMSFIKVPDVLKAIEENGLLSFKKGRSADGPYKTQPEVIEKVKVYKHGQGARELKLQDIVVSGVKGTKVLYITESEVVYSGGRYYGWMVMKALAERGFNIWVYTNRIPPFYLDFNTAEFKGNFTTIVDESLYVNKFIREFDYVVGEPYHTGITAVAYRDTYCPNAKVVNFVYETPNYIREYRKGDDANESFWKAYKEALLKSDVIVTLSSLGVEKVYEWDSRFKQKQVVAIEPSCNSRISKQFKPSRSAGRRYYGAIYISMYKDYKNFPFFFELVQQVCPNKPVIVIGYKAEYLKRKYEPSGLQIKALENVSDKDKFKHISMADCMIVPTKFEGFGMTPIEAMVLETPVFCSKLPIFKQNYKSHVSYIDITSVSKAAVDVKAGMHRFDLAERLAKSKEWALKHYSFEALIERTKRVFDDVKIHCEDRVRVAIMTPYNEKCGIAENTKWYVDELVKQKVRLIVLAPTDNPSIREDEPYVFRCWSRKSGNYDRVIDLIRQYDINVLHIQHEFSFVKDIDAFIKFLEKVKSYGVKVVITYHTYFIGLGLFDRLAMVVDSQVVANGSVLKKVALRGLYDLVHIPLPCIKRDEIPIEEARKKLGLPLGRKYMTCHGFFHRHKGYHIAVDALEYLPDWNLIIVGHADRKNQYYVEIRVKAKKYGERVLLNTEYLPMEDVMTYLYASNVILYPYLVDSHYSASAAVRTGLASKRLCLCSNSTMFEDLGNAVLKFKMNDPKSLADKLLYAYRDKNKMKNAIVGAASLVNKTTPDKIAEMHLSLYKSLLKGR
ncbi:MAG: hypothetical protein DRN81_02635 [Thermoproteota archaeon]|nr:MAG: hypothetical protein DRN81_02635 [Candidatus Korarchaeota archaeon]